MIVAIQEENSRTPLLSFSVVVVVNFAVVFEANTTFHVYQLLRYFEHKAWAFSNSV